MRVEINENLFKEMLDSVKHCVAVNDVRAYLQFIKIVVKSDTVTAYSLDGFRAAKTQITLSKAAEKDFVCYIKPFAFKPLKNGINPVVIECDGDYAYVEFDTEFGKCRYSFKHPDEDWGELPEKVYKENEMHDRELGMSARYISQACKALGGITGDRLTTVVLETKANNLSPFIIRAHGEGIISEQLILPIRLTDDYNKKYEANKK